MIFRSRFVLLALLLGFFAACSGSSEPNSGGSEPDLMILVTNDDGVKAEGIDALVEALVENEKNDVFVVAPNGNRSGSGENSGPSEQCGDLSVEDSATLGGYPAIAIDGCPADAVTYGLAILDEEGRQPDIVLSGINEGQNVSALIGGQISGTVGAAKTAVRAGVPGTASSQGIPAAGGEFDFPAGAEAVTSWLAEHRDAIADGVQPVAVENINIPSCSVGSIRGTRTDLPLAPTPEGAVEVQDCESTLEDPTTDVEALNNGFISEGPVPLD